MIKGQRFLKTINRINEYLMIIPTTRIMQKALRLMTENEDSFFTCGIKQWETNKIEASMKKLVSLGHLDKDKADPSVNLKDAIVASNSVNKGFAILLERKFKADRELAIYIKCHTDFEHSSGDGLSTLIQNLLEGVRHIHNEDDVIEEIGQNVLDLIGEYFDYDILLLKYMDDIHIEIGWDKPQPINVVPYDNMVNKAEVDKEGMKEFFEKFDVIKL